MEAGVMRVVVAPVVAKVTLLTPTLQRPFN